MDQLLGYTLFCTQKGELHGTHGTMAKSATEQGDQLDSPIEVGVLMMWSRECHKVGKHVPLCTLCIQGPLVHAYGW